MTLEYGEFAKDDKCFYRATVTVERWALGWTKEQAIRAAVERAQDSASRYVARGNASRSSWRQPRKRPSRTGIPTRSPMMTHTKSASRSAACSGNSSAGRQAMSSEKQYAICRFAHMMGELQESVPITPAQAALGAMTDREVAMALMARDDRRGGTPLALLADDQAWIQEAISRGLWPPEVGEGNG